jgi:helix-turn-helix protein
MQNKLPKTKNLAREQKSQAMKTSVILSTLAALCLIITFAESPKHQNTQANNTISVDHISYISANLTAANSEAKLSSNSGKETTVKNNDQVSYEENEPTVNEFDYLKFNVIDYATTESVETPETPVNEFEYLKFNVNDYTTNVSDETPETPANEFEYLKFNVNDYTTKVSDETPETQVNEFEYLKFNVNDYTTTESVETPETPANEFEYLKFKVNDYTNSETYSNETIE